MNTILRIQKKQTVIDWITPRDIEWALGIIFAIIANYIALAYKVKQITWQINGLGQKLGKEAEKLRETEKDVEYINGYLQGASQGLFKPK